VKIELYSPSMFLKTGAMFFKTPEELTKWYSLYSIETVPFTILILFHRDCPMRNYQENSTFGIAKKGLSNLE
jgi:hypothetical protein